MPYDRDAFLREARMIGRGKAISRGYYRDADDIAQTVCLRLAQGLPRLRQPQARWAFLGQIVQFTIMDARRNQNSRERWQALPHESALPVSDPQVVDSLELKSECDRALGALHPLDRAVLRRFYIDGQTAEEIQQEMGLSDTQFRLRKNRALNKAHQALTGKERRRKS